MPSVFEGKVRRLGNSLAVIVPREVLLEIGAREGDVIKLSVPIPPAGRRAALRRWAGSAKGASLFVREKRERV